MENNSYSAMIPGYACNRCGHTWAARKKTLPKTCSNCKSPYWNMPRKKVIQQSEIKNEEQQISSQV